MNHKIYQINITNQFLKEFHNKFIQKVINSFIEKVNSKQNLVNERGDEFRTDLRNVFPKRPMNL